jgi:glucosamine-6-phosphate isomerase
MEADKKIFADSTEASRYCADTLEAIIRNKPNALICLAAGHTSLEFFSMLVKDNEEGKIDFSRVKAVGLDEWAGLSGNDDGSCESFMRRNLYDHINICEDNIRLFSGKARDLMQECRDIDRFIEENNGIDYIFLGLGMNGHLALNEPGADPESTSHVTPLDSVTRQVAVKYFDEMPEISRGITLGIKNILDSKLIQLLITGKMKREIVKRIFSSEVTDMLPATLLFGHGNAEVILDAQAAGLSD